MKLFIISFTKTGYALSEKIREQLSAFEAELLFKGKPANTELSLHEICRKAFEDKTALLFIGAMGIAVRHIAPFVKDKLTDPPVLVMDEKGLHVIPVLSGHVGGANELAFQIAELFGSDPVITTATDLQKAFSVDLFAKENRLQIVNRDGIAKVSVKALEGKPVTLSIKDYPPKEPVDILITNERERFSEGTIALKSPAYTLGVGCKKGKSEEEIENLVSRVLDEAGLGFQDIYAVGTIDIKENEEGLRAFTKKHSLPFFTFEASLLKEAKGDFTPSAFVKDTTGVDNVCERAAVLAAGPHGTLYVKKQAENGVTAAIAKR